MIDSPSLITLGRLMSVTVNHPIRGRFQSWFLASLDNMFHRIYGQRKAALTHNLPGTIVEIGPGTGANFRYYPQGTKVIAIEPNVQMYARLTRKAKAHGIDLTLRGLKGESVDLADNSVDFVASTLVLCSVDNPAQVVSEIKRILKPGGHYMFIEHVAAREGTWLRQLQRAVRPPWQYAFEGCCPDRESWKVIEHAGFSALSLEHFDMRSPFIHIRPHIAGLATK